MSRQVFWTHRWPSPRRRSSRHHRARPGRRIPAAVRQRAVRACRGRGRVAVPSRRPRAQHTAELKRLAAAARQRTKYDRDAAAASRRDQQARGQRRRQVANVQVPWSEIRGTCFRTHPQQLAVAAAAAASHPELDDGKIIPEATVDSQVRPEPPARSPPTPSPARLCVLQPVRELTRCPRAPRPRSCRSCWARARAGRFCRSWPS